MGKAEGMFRYNDKKGLQDGPYCAFKAVFKYNLTTCYEMRSMLKRLFNHAKRIKFITVQIAKIACIKAFRGTFWPKPRGTFTDTT